MPGRTYFAVMDRIAVSAAQDLFEIQTSATSGIDILSCVVSQSSDYGDAQAEGLPILIIRGHTTTGNGTTITPAQANPNGGAFGGTVKRNSTTAATGGSPVTVHADAFNVQAGWMYTPVPKAIISVAPSSRVVVNLPVAPADAITVSATLVFESTS